ncbi:hypothetical protein GP486_004471 [Trichoglossum hirsutum]|uniref:Uncharacterized protein n=1 Tax=Trichoglossum hirsutum TaxID=265104 RepID=A0A9P8LB39_9PEZI|nr:hypothetical protein GP486_004471 [Trichoglossum hirsutum]
MWPFFLTVQDLQNVCCHLNIALGPGVERTHISLEKIWAEKAGTQQPIGQYLNQTFVNIYAADQWQLFKDFVAEYKDRFGRSPILNPEGQFKMDFLQTTKKELQDRGLQEQNTYKAWFDKHIITTDEEGCSNALFLTPWSSGEPDYRDTYRERPSWAGDGFRYWFVCPYAEAPEMIIPIGQMSRVTHQREWLPVAIGVMSAKGTDIDLVELIRDMMVETGMETQVKVGRTPFQMRDDHESVLKQEDGQRSLRLFDPSG